MFHYKCPRCGNVSDEGFSIIGGPDCVRCGVEMRPAGGPADEVRGGDTGAREAQLRDSPARSAAQGD